MNVIALKTMIKNLLSTLADRVYDTQVQPGAKFPYVTYTLSDSTTDENQKREDFILEVDIWDNKPLDATDLDTLTGTIDGDGSGTAATGLHRKHYYSAGVLRADIYRINRFELDDEDPSIRRRKLRYQVMAYLLS